MYVHVDVCVSACVHECECVSDLSVTKGRIREILTCKYCPVSAELLTAVGDAVIPASTHLCSSIKSGPGQSDRMAEETCHGYEMTRAVVTYGWLPWGESDRNETPKSPPLTGL